MKNFLIGFSACLLLFIVLNFAFYLLVSTEAYQTIGIPWRFYHQSGDDSRFRVIHFIMDLGLALYCSYKAGTWWALHCWRKGRRDA